VRSQLTKKARQRASKKKPKGAEPLWVLFADVLGRNGVQKRAKGMKSHIFLKLSLIFLNISEFMDMYKKTYM
jgi:hypothetical protein